MPAWPVPAARATASTTDASARSPLAAAIEAGVPKRRIEEAAAETQARIDTGEQVIVGVNAYQCADEVEAPVRKIDNAAVRSAQIARLNQLRAERDAHACERALEALTGAAASGHGNLLALAVDAARAKASLGEVSDALEKAWGRHQAKVDGVTGVYARLAGEDEAVRRARAAAEAFAKARGGPPRIYIAKLGQDGHDRGQKVVASAFADLGWQVEIGPLFQTPEEAARDAAAAKSHVVAASSLAAAHLTVLPELKRALAEVAREDALIVVGGVIPPDDVGVWRQMGAAAVFPPGTVIAEAALELLEGLQGRLGGG